MSVGRDTGHVRGAVALIDDFGTRWSLQCTPNTGGYSPAYEQVAVAHGTRFGIAIFPAEFLRPERVALAQCLAGEWLARLRISSGVIDRTHV